MQWEGVISTTTGILELSRWCTVAVDVERSMCASVRLGVLNCGINSIVATEGKVVG